MNEIISEKMIALFGEENLVYAQKDKIHNIPIEKSVKFFFTSVGLPNNINFVKFFMNLVPLSQDTYINQKFTNIDEFYSFGLKIFNPFIIVNSQFEAVGLPPNPNIKDILDKIDELNLKGEDSYDLSEEVFNAHRICIDTKKNCVVSVVPNMEKIIFFNSSIQKLALSAIAFAECKSTQEFIESILSIDPEAICSQDNWWSQMALSLEEFFLNQS